MVKPKGAVLIEWSSFRARSRINIPKESQPYAASSPVLAPGIAFSSILSPQARTDWIVYIVQAYQQRPTMSDCGADVYFEVRRARVSLQISHYLDRLFVGLLLADGRL